MKMIYIALYVPYGSGTVAQWSALSPHNEKVLGSISGSGPLCVEFSRSPRVRLFRWRWDRLQLQATLHTSKQ